MALLVNEEILRKHMLTLYLDGRMDPYPRPSQFKACCENVMIMIDLLIACSKDEGSNSGTTGK